MLEVVEGKGGARRRVSVAVSEQSITKVSRPGLLQAPPTATRSANSGPSIAS